MDESVPTELRSQPVSTHIQAHIDELEEPLSRDSIRATQVLLNEENMSKTMQPLRSHRDETRSNERKQSVPKLNLQKVAASPISDDEEGQDENGQAKAANANHQHAGSPSQSPQQIQEAPKKSVFENSPQQEKNKSQEVAEPTVDY